MPALMTAFAAGRSAGPIVGASRYVPIPIAMPVSGLPLNRSSSKAIAHSYHPACSRNIAGMGRVQGRATNGNGRHGLRMFAIRRLRVSFALYSPSSDAQQKLLFDGEDHRDGLLRRIGSSVIGMRSP